MQKRTIKYQAAIFGKFSFAADADTTVRLTSIFAPLGFLPQVVNAVDMGTGLGTQRLAFSKGVSEGIQFAPDRIDFTIAMPTVDLNMFIEQVHSYLAKLDYPSFKFTRIAIVVDELLEELSPEELSTVRAKLLPLSQRNAFEWTARWIEPQSDENEQYNVCLEAMTANGLMIVMGGKMEPLSGLKVMTDVSTAVSNTAPRFDIGNVMKGLQAVAAIIRARSEWIQ